MGQPFVLGVNYWPRKKAMYWWSDFDPGEVEEEFSVIKELGLTLVRIFLLWEDFQPAPDEISLSALENLITVCDIAANQKIKLDVTFFTGHMSGPNWAPQWMLIGERPKYVRQVVSGKKIVENGYLNPYSDPIMIKAQKYQLQTIVQLLKDHPGIGIWNLGNEPDIFAFLRYDCVGEKCS